MAQKSKRLISTDRPTVNAIPVYQEQYNKLYDDVFNGTGPLSAASLSLSGDLTVSGTTTLNGNLVLGDAATDSLTINAEATYSDIINYSNATTITAGTTQTMAGATALTEEINNVTTVANANDGVALPTAIAGRHIYIKNSGANNLRVWTGNGSDTIDAQSVTALGRYVLITPGASLDFYAKDAVTWETNKDASISISAPGVSLGALQILAANSAGDTITTITNASQAAARTYIIPDAGAATANFILSTINQTAATTDTVNATVTVNSTNYNFISAGVTPSAALTGSELITGTNFSLTSLLADADSTGYIGHKVNMISANQATTYCDMTGINIINSGSVVNGANTVTHTGISVVPTLTINTAGTAHYYGANFDLSGMTLTAASDVYGVRVVGMAGVDAGIILSGASTTGIDISGATTLINLSADGTVANARQTLLSSRDINGTVAGAVALTNFANVLGQAVSHSGGDFIVTQTATTAGILNLVLAHTTSIATTAPDVFASTALNIDVDATTNTDAGADLDVSARALNITYDLTETLGVLRLAATDVARIDLNVPTGITSAAGYNLTMLNLDGSGYLGNDANTTLRGINLDLSGAKTVSAMRGIDITMEAASTTSSIGIYVDAGSSTNNTGISIAAWQAANVDSTSQALLVNKIVSVSGTPAANSTNSSYAAKISMANLNSCTDGSDALCTANGLEIVYSTTSTADTVLTADTLTGTALKLTLAGTTAANAFSGINDFSPKGLLVDYDISFGAASTFNVTAHNIIDINYATGATAGAAFASGSYNFFNVIATNNAASPAYAATTTISAYNANLSNMVVTDADLVLNGMLITAPTAAGSVVRSISLAGAPTAHIYSSTALIVDMPVTAPGAGFDTANGVKVIPYGKRGASGMFVTEIYVDLQAAAVSSKNTVNDIIGEAAGGAAYIGQMTAALNGTVVAIEMVCLEAPTTGDADIDLYSATENNGAYDADVTGLTEVALITAGGSWTNGMVKGSTALPAGASDYLYLASGNGGVAGAYNAGIFLIRIYGV